MGRRAEQQAVTHEWGRLLNAAHPGFLDAVLTRIRDSEYAYTGEQGDSFLVDHTLQVCSLVFRLCRMQQADSYLPVLVALFHDAGKFHHGTYHEAGVPEEEHSAVLARKFMDQHGFDIQVIEAVCASIQALYVESAEKTLPCNLVHDADCLVKSGCAGVVQFFIKSTLRSKGMLTTLRRSLSKELTYTSVLVHNMRTAAGSTLARTRQDRASEFFRSLIDELREDGILALRVDTFEPELETGSSVPIVIVREAACNQCGSGTAVRFRQEPGIKCTKLIADVACIDCSAHNQIAFCLPEIKTAAAALRPLGFEGSWPDKIAPSESEGQSRHSDHSIIKCGEAENE